MIKYKLICKNCNITFNSWFASSAEYEKLKKKKYLTCHNCNSSHVEKTLMAPSVSSKSKIEKAEKNSLNIKEINKKMKEYQKFIRKNFEYVGKNFAYEARSLHYDTKKNKKGIYGMASNEEIKELKEEGIDADVIPWIDDKKN